jgi:hypothetical protein
MQQRTAVVDVLGAAELEFRIALLTPISRSAHLASPRRHAERLVKLWHSPDGEVSLAEAFRLLGVDAVAGVIQRVATERDYQGDPRIWHFPPLAELLPELREAAWQEALAGKLVLEGVKGIRGRRHQPVELALLPRLTPEWELARLTRDGRDEWIDVRACPIAAAALPKPWQKGKPSCHEIKAAAQDAAEAYSSEDPPSFDQFWAAIKIRAPGATQLQVRDALKKHVPHLRRGIGKKIKSSG